MSAEYTSGKPSNTHLDLVVNTTRKALVAVGAPLDSSNRAVTAIVKLGNRLLRVDSQVPHAHNAVVAASENEFTATRDGDRDRVERPKVRGVAR